MPKWQNGFYWNIMVDVGRRTIRRRGSGVEDLEFIGELFFGVRQTGAGRST